MAITYEPIATTTLGTAAASITFSSIATGYTDLKWVLVCSNGTSLKDLNITYNSDTGTNYSATRLVGDTSSPKAGRYTNAANIRIASAVGYSTYGPSMISGDISSYREAVFKTSLITSSVNNSGWSTEIIRTVGLWRSTSAITSITLTCESPTNFLSGTTATLYGILKA
jgi:hypothetical protein